MAQARLRLRCPEVLAQRAVQVRLPDLAVYPRCTPLRTSRGVGGYAVTSAPEGRGLHPHGNRVTRPHGLAACLEVLTSFQPTGHSSQFVAGRRWWPWTREGREAAYVFADDEPCTGEEICR